MHRADAAVSVATERRRRQRPFPFIGRSCEPADVVAALEPSLQPQTRFRAQNFEGAIGDVAHVLKHPRTMPGDNVGILHRGATNSKDVVHESKGSMPNSPSQGYGAAGVQRPALNEDALRPNERARQLPRPLGLIPCRKWKRPIGHRSATRNFSNAASPSSACGSMARHLNRSSGSSTTSSRPTDSRFIHHVTSAIFVPFFLVHDRLRALERTMMLEVGGRGLRAFGGQGGPALSAIDRPDYPARDQNGSGLIGDRLREHAETR